MRTNNHYVKKVIVFCVLLAAAASVISAQGAYTISGTIKCSVAGTLYVYLVDEETFKIPLTGIRKQIIRIDDNNTNIRFVFEDVAKGKYGIRCFLDKNGNSTLDSGLFGPTEPWGMSFKKERPFGQPSFNDICFEVNADKNNIFIEVK
jgi:uncharacterized protein (DUF2141 family)